MGTSGFEQFFSEINPTLWVIGNVVLAIVAISTVTFVISYYVLFDPKATTAGKLIFRFMVSLTGVLALTFLGAYIDPPGNNAWMSYPPFVDWWRPGVRLVIFSYQMFTVVSLAVFLGIRKWAPHRVKTAHGEQDFVKVRHDTAETPVVNKSSLEGRND